jgi:imidazolonepropionase-like amidohydrolase
VQATAADRKKALGSLAAAVTHEHVDACGGLANYLAVLGIVKRCLDVPATGGGSAAGSGASPRYTDEQVRKALAELRAAGRPVTLQTMQATLDGTPARRTVPAPPPNNYHPDVPIWERM